MDSDETGEKPNFISCLTFVQRGVAKPKPERIKPTQEELKEIIKEMKLKEAEYEGRPKNDKPGDSEEMKATDSDDEIDAYYDMDNYDDEPTDPAAAVRIEDLILQNPEDSNDDDSDSGDEKEEYSIRPTDNLILIGHVEDDVCMLEVYVFNNDEADLFIQHDILLPSYPIAIEWMNFSPTEPDTNGHFAAIGSMSPHIDVWDLNVTGCLEPAFSLGTKKLKGNRHKEAVLDLAWNNTNRNILASGSADSTVLLWDMAEQKSVMKLAVFEEKVQSVKWHPIENQNLLTGSCEGKVRLFDCRSSSTFKTWIFDGEIEKVLWNKFNPLCFFATNDEGMVHYVDIRNPKAIWNLRAHDKEVSGIALSSHCSDLLITGSMDETVKVWDLKDDKPSLVVTKLMNIGSVCALSSCPDVPYVFCAGGTKKDNNMYLWDIRENETVVDRFKDRRLEETYEIQVNFPKHEDGNTENDVSMDQEDNIPGPSTSSSSSSNFRPMDSTNLKDGRIVANKDANSKSKNILNAVRSESENVSQSKSSHKKKHGKKK